MSNDIDRVELRRLDAAATPGPWEAADASVWSDTHGFILGRGLDSLDADLIAKFRTAVPALLDALEQAEARIQAVRDVHRPVEVEPSDTICGGCSTLRGRGESLRYFPTEEWPCPTIRTLDA